MNAGDAPAPPPRWRLTGARLPPCVALAGGTALVRRRASTLFVARLACLSPSVPNILDHAISQATLFIALSNSRAPDHIAARILDSATFHDGWSNERGIAS